jgi:hypothetical protein
MSTVGNSLSSALTVYKGVGTGSLSDLNRGGGNVPNYTCYSGISATDAGLRLSQLVGTISPPVQFSSITPYISTPNGGTATLDVYSGGTYAGTNSGGDTWLLYGSAGNFDVRLNKSSGATPTGSSVNTWINMASSQSWSLTQAAGGPASKNMIGSFDIRDSSSGTVIVSGIYVEMTAEDYS